MNRWGMGMAGDFVQEALRVALVCAHVLGVIAAFVGIAAVEYGMFGRSHTRKSLVKLGAHVVACSLALLWLTGLAILARDTGLQWDAIAAKPKVLAKLLTVSLLSLNGVLLHRYALPVMLSLQPNPVRAAWVPTVLGAISMATWLSALFIALSTPLAVRVGVAGYMALLAAAWCAAVAVALVVAKPRLQTRMAANNAMVLGHMAVRRASKHAKATTKQTNVTSTHARPGASRPRATPLTKHPAVVTLES